VWRSSFFSPFVPELSPRIFLAFLCGKVSSVLKNKDGRISELLLGHAGKLRIVAGQGLQNTRKSEALPSKKAKIRQLVPKF
jgi:hypothetical protein